MAARRRASGEDRRRDSKGPTMRGGLFSIAAVLLLIGCSGTTSNTVSVTSNPGQAVVSGDESFPSDQRCATSASTSTQISPLGNYVESNRTLREPHLVASIADYEIVTLSFDGERLRLCGPCLQWNGSYTWTDGRLSVAELETVDRECFGFLRAETWMREMIAPRSSPDVELAVAGETVTLTGDETRILTFTRTEHPLDWPLQQTVWRLVAGASDGATTWAETHDAPPIILIIDGGRLTIESECGSASAAAAADGREIILSDAVINGSSCADAEEAARQTVVGGAAGGARDSVPYTLTGSTLVVGQIEYLPDGVTTVGYELAFVAEPIAALTFRTG